MQAPAGALLQVSAEQLLDPDATWSCLDLKNHTARDIALGTLDWREQAGNLLWANWQPCSQYGIRDWDSIGALKSWSASIEVCNILSKAECFVAMARAGWQPALGQLAAVFTVRRQGLGQYGGPQVLERLPGGVLVCTHITCSSADLTILQSCAYVLQEQSSKLAC